jgi:hypothetical protein
MKVTYTENEKRHILESSNGYLATYLKSQLTKEEAEQSFKLSLKMMTFEQEEIDNSVTGEPHKEYFEFTDVTEEVPQKPEKKNG